MSRVMPGRFTAETNESFVVFLIGMRINKFFAFNKWVPTAMAMTPMLRGNKAGGTSTPLFAYFVQAS